MPGCVPTRRDRGCAIGVRVARPPEQRARDEPLIERELAVEDVAAGQTVGALEIERRDHLALTIDDSNPGA